MPAEPALCSQILKVEAAEGGAALVTARLKERGDLWAAMGKRSNDASYSKPLCCGERVPCWHAGWMTEAAGAIAQAGRQQPDAVEGASC